MAQVEEDLQDLLLDGCWIEGVAAWVFAWISLDFCR